MFLEVVRKPGFPGKQGKKGKYCVIYFLLSEKKDIPFEVLKMKL